MKNNIVTNDFILNLNYKIKKNMRIQWTNSGMVKQKEKASYWNRFLQKASYRSGIFLLKNPSIKIATTIFELFHKKKKLLRANVAITQK